MREGPFWFLRAWPEGWDLFTAEPCRGPTAECPTGVPPIRFVNREPGVRVVKERQKLDKQRTPFGRCWVVWDGNGETNIEHPTSNTEHRSEEEMVWEQI